MNETLIKLQLLVETRDTKNLTQITFDVNSEYNSNNNYYNNNNINSNQTTIEMDEDMTARNAIIISSYSLIIFISLCGNLLVCKIAFSNLKKKLRNTTNMLIASLAFSDIVMTAFNIPFNVARLLLLDWPFGPFLCFFVPFIQTSCVYVSTFTMTFIAIHRVWSLTKKSNSNLNCNNSKYRIIIAVLVIWLLAFSLSLPHSIYNEIKQVPYNGMVLTRCRVTYPQININFRLLLTIEVFLTQYLMPLTITTLLYIKIGRIVSAQGKILVTSDNERRRAQTEAKRRRILMLALVVIVFAVCWLPLNGYYLLVDFKLIKHDFKFFIVCHWFAMSSVCYNPFIYCWRDDTFREGAQKLLLLNTIRKRNNNDIIGEQNSIKSRNNDSMRKMTRIELPDKNLRISSKDTLTTSDL